ncbi:MAG: carbon storage regulator CsrA [Armatimonadetes bacterium]|jgi:carbon storage regulator|nr:carbon storage regulator CsrA [Armatimonadota bacterium]
MLVLARKVGQSIIINDNVEVLVIEVRGDQVRLGIEAPRAIPVHRKELFEQIREENIRASTETDVESATRALGDTQP